MAGTEKRPAAVRLARSGGLERVLRVATALPLILGLSWGALITATTLTNNGPHQRDFSVYWVAGTLARTKGLAAIYDGHSCVPLFAAVHIQPPFTCASLLYPPQHVWIMEIVSLLPLPVAYALWCVLICAAYVAAGRLLVPKTPTWPLWVGLPLLAPALAFSINWLGLITPLQLLALAAGLVLLKRHPVISGTLLALFAFKPEAFLFVPIALLLADRRAFVAFVATTAAIVGITLLQIGVPGLVEYSSTLRTSTQLGFNDRLGLSALTGYSTVATAVLEVIAAAGALLALWRLRHSPDLALAAAVPASLLVSPYLHSPDLMLALPAAWLWARRETDSIRPRLGMGAILGTMVAAAPATVVLACATLAAGPSFPGRKPEHPTD